MKRVVVTGLGVVAPNGNNVASFLEALKKGKSGIRFSPELQELNFNCQIGGVPQVDDSLLKEYYPKSFYRGLKGWSIKYAALASIEAFRDAGLKINNEETDWDTGCVYGQAVGDFLVLKNIIDAVEKASPRKMGSRYVSLGMNSGPCAYLTHLFGFGNRIISNASACSTGSESILLAYETIKNGNARRMVAGSSECNNVYSWGAFEAMRILCSNGNEQPEKAYRPMSHSAAGIVLGGGSATLILEDLELARERGAKIYAEILGGAVNSGGQRSNGTMTMPNNEGVQKCISKALETANIAGNEVDLICGHLTATQADKVEVGNWKKVLHRSKNNFPYINSLKSMTGHCIGAAGSIESLAAILQLKHGFIHPNLNCEDLHPEIEEMIGADKVPTKKIDKKINTIIKANFGFGDVNCCLVFRKFDA